MPTPTANTPSIKVTTVPLPCSTSRARVGNSASTIVPIAQNQLMPSTANQIFGPPAARRRSETLLETIFHPGRRPGCATGVCGIAQAARIPATATARQASEAATAPCGSTTSSPPATVPSRMPTKVPASISPFPATSASPAKKSGRSRI